MCREFMCPQAAPAMSSTSQYICMGQDTSPRISSTALEHGPATFGMRPIRVTCWRAMRYLFTLTIRRHSPELREAEACTSMRPQLPSLHNHLRSERRRDPKGDGGIQFMRSSSSLLSLSMNTVLEGMNPVHSMWYITEVLF